MTVSLQDIRYPIDGCLNRYSQSQRLVVHAIVGAVQRLKRKSHFEVASITLHHTKFTSDVVGNFRIPPLSVVVLSRKVVMVIDSLGHNHWPLHDAFQGFVLRVQFPMIRMKKAATVKIGFFG